MNGWITRDNNGNLWFHAVKFNSAGMVNNKVIYSLDKDLFPEINFENSPQRVELKLVK
jgi:hypothetical protein